MNRTERRARAKKTKPRTRADTIATVMASGIECHRAGDLAAAERHYRDVLVADPSHGDAVHLLGVLALFEGRAADSIDLIRRALTLKPNFAEAYNNLGMALVEVGDTVSAESAFRKSVSLRSDFADPHTNIGNLSLQRGEPATAIGHYLHSLSISPSDADTLFNLGNAYMKDGAIDRAIDAYRSALAHAPTHGPALRNLAHNLAQQTGRADEAWLALRRAAEAAISADKNAAEPWFHLATALRELDEPAEEDALRSYLQRDSDDKMGAGLALAKRGGGALPIRHSPSYVARVYSDKAFIAGAGAEDRGYNGHRLILDALAPILKERQNMRVLDAGCGAGRLGSAIRDRVAVLEGVDVSEQMIGRARETDSFDLLKAADLDQFLPEHRDRYDLIFLAAVLVHYSDLSGILSILRDSLRDGGALVFTTFKLPDDNHRKFDTTAYNFFAHNAEYLENSMIHAGFSDLKIIESIHEFHGEIPRMCYVVTATLP